MNALEKRLRIKADKDQFAYLSRKTNQMPIKINTSEPHDKWVYILARREYEQGYDVIVNGRLTGGRGFPDIAVCGLSKIIEVLWSETLEKAKEKVGKYPEGWDIDFFSAEEERYL